MPAVSIVPGPFPVITLTPDGSNNVAVNCNGDGSLGNALAPLFQLTLTASGWTITDPTNVFDGQMIRIRIAQDGVGGHTVIWSLTGWSFGAQAIPTLSTAPNAIDELRFTYFAAKSKAGLYMSIAKGF